MEVIISTIMVSLMVLICGVATFMYLKDKDPEFDVGDIICRKGSEPWDRVFYKIVEYSPTAYGIKSINMLRLEKSLEKEVTPITLKRDVAYLYERAEK